MDSRIEKVANGTLEVIQKNINVCREEFFKVFPDGDDEYFRDIEGRIESAIRAIQLLKSLRKESIIRIQDMHMWKIESCDDRAILDIEMVLFLTCGLVIRSS